MKLNIWWKLYSTGYIGVIETVNGNRTLVHDDDTIAAVELALKHLGVTSL